MQPIKSRCSLDTDHWDHVGKVYHIHSMKRKKDSTATTLTLEDDHGNIFTTTVAYHQIEFME